MKNRKQEHSKTKEQIAAEMEIMRLRKFASDKFYPFLLKQTKSVSDARIFLQVIDTVVKGAFNEGLTTTKVGDLKLEERIKKTAPDDQQAKYQELLEMFKGESITSFIRIVSDFNQIIGGLMQEWERENALTKLKSPFPAVAKGK